MKFSSLTLRGFSIGLSVVTPFIFSSNASGQKKRFKHRANMI